MNENIIQEAISVEDKRLSSSEKLSEKPNNLCIKITLVIDFSSKKFLLLVEEFKIDCAGCIGTFLRMIIMNRVFPIRLFWHWLSPFLSNKVPFPWISLCWQWARQATCGRIFDRLVTQLLHFYNAQFPHCGIHPSLRMCQVSHSRPWTVAAFYGLLNRINAVVTPLFQWWLSNSF